MQTDGDGVPHQIIHLPVLGQTGGVLKNNLMGARAQSRRPTPGHVGHAAGQQTHTNNSL